MKNLFAFCLLLPFAAHAATPAIPGSDIWMVDLKTDGDALSARNPRNLTSRPGYDNQPAFISEHSFLYTAMDASGQTDAWRYDLDGEVLPLRVTPESEYSPTPTPGAAVSVVRVSQDGVQQLWLLKPYATEYELLFPLLEGVGYHAWLDEDRVALFMVREPSELHIANRKTGEVLVLAKDIGRSLQRVPGEAAMLAFTEPGHDGKRWIKQYDFAARRIVSLAPLPGQGEDFVFLPDGRLVIADGRRLLVWRDDAWQELANFPDLPGEISRISVSPDMTRLLLVVAEAV